MNKTVEEFIRKTIKEKLQYCSLAEQKKFKQMYCKRVNTDINIVVDEMPSEKLDWALTQIENTIKKREKMNV